MPTPLQVLTRPQLRRPSPGPQPVNLVLVFWVGIAAWALALAAAVALAATRGLAGQVVATCVVGLVLGFVGLLWARRR